MTLDDVNGIKKYAESVLASPMNADRYIQRYKLRSSSVANERFTYMDSTLLMLIGGVSI